MGNLKVHDKLDIQAGGQVEVLDEFGSGGQGTVYKVSYNGILPRADLAVQTLQIMT